MPNTYTELLKTTVGTATSSVTLSLTGISGYTDLVLVINATADSGNPDSRIKFNGNTSNNMSGTILTGNGTTASSARRTSLVQMEIDWTGMGTGIGQYVIHIMNYANTTTNKTFLVRSAFAAKGTDAIVGMWANTAAITSITIDVPAANYVSGSTFSLYGIANADQGAAKATGGMITEDSQYWYHTFAASSAFIPKQSLSCDILAVAGGGGGGGSIGNQGSGGGGAGGVLAFSSQALTAISYNVTVGAGGAGGLGQDVPFTLEPGSNGNNSQFASLTSSVAGGGGGGNAPDAGNAGGSGGGGTNFSGAGGTATSGQGSDGGAGNASSNQYGGSGGGAGAVGTTGGAGGAGTNSVTNWGALSSMLTATGLGVSGFIAGGGGTASTLGGTAGGSGGGGAANKASQTAATSGTANTGSGGGAHYETSAGGTGARGGAGGSGIVIVRYAK
jgi:hypothetical protein